MEIETQILDSLDYEKSFLDYATLRSEVISIEKRLYSKGYIENELLSFQKTNDSVYLAKFDLGHRYERIRIYYNESINRKIIKLVSENIEDDYFELSFDKLETSLELLNSEFANQGDPFSELQLSEIKKEGTDLLSAKLKITTYKSRTIDSIIVKGYEKFPKSYIKRFLKIKRKQPFNLNTIKRKTSNLENLRFASQIKEPEVLFTNDSTIIYMYIEKQKSNAFDGFIGFGTNEETNKIEFDGYLNLALVNNLNYGESLRLFYKSDENEQKTFDVKAHLPYLFGSPLGLELGLNIFKRDSTFLTTTQNVRLEYQFNPKNQVFLGYRSINSDGLLEGPNNFIQDFESRHFTVNYLFTLRQRYDLLFPINFLVDIGTGFGNRTFESVSEPQTIFELDGFKIFNLNDRNSIYIGVAANYLISDSYLENELYRFGGINSIRGFEENSLLANIYGVLNTEYRYRLSSGLYVHSVIDAAYAENKILNSKNKLFGVGFGFGLLTNAGLFKFNYSTGKTDNQPIKLADSKIHISLTANF